MRTSKSFALVVAADEAGGIGKGGALPWRLANELAYFKQLTSEAPTGLQNALIMGRKTFDSIAPRHRPLPGRLNIVLSRDADYAPTGALAAVSLERALAAIDERDDISNVFVIGASNFPQNASYNPTDTVGALAYMAADAIVNRYLKSPGPMVPA